ncbi:MAG: Glutamate Aspartate transport system permease protein GltJ (TC 3.A.1.3.4) [uncultured Thiotrichaceae bacterium]|uniref:Glutamate Aspartate transport system permease protein GltJ (TC 3.A.1.3.4) n=1 Tax=uncultured Thiotrichaceae bacterium TaxID=298394 RepID=A0A6S6TND5_9GAMM|nr:MAG: Glutamate Aspartate transport system permease protein GltJ (TC 3.A.1.3.4) [uncultured Thiotrichaceae bacterium]
MQDASSGSKGSSVLTKLLYNSTWRGWLFQGLVLLGLASFFIWIISNTVDNLQRLDKKTGFGFLDQKAGFEILTSPGTAAMNYAPGVSTYMDVFWVGVVNTIFVAVIGIIAATLLGFLMGIMRLSKNKVLSSIATVYVEIFRNIPLLLQILFWYSLMIKSLPDGREQLAIFGDLGGLNNRGLFMPQPIFESGFGYVALAFLGGLVACWLYAKAATAIQYRTGKRPPGWPMYLLLLIGIPLAVFFLLDRPMSWDLPVFKTDGPILRRGFDAEAGMALKPELLALWIALSVYTAAFIGEIVRSGILAVSHGQTEASQALGLRSGLIQRLVVIPQAMRVIVPPLTSQFLNLTKNSSLAVAIAYPDIVSVFAGTALNVVGQEIEMIFMMMMVYLILSLSTSLFMNWFNNRIKLVER